MKEKKRSLPAIWKDPDDAPSLDASFFESAELFDGASPKPRGRPKAAMTKEPIKLRLDAAVLAALRASGDGWQTRVMKCFGPLCAYQERLLPPRITRGLER